MTAALENLVEILSPTKIGEDHYQGLGSKDDGVDATFGGHFLGQATAAASATVDDDRYVHSIHAYFLRAGTPGVPFDLHVDRVREGRSFCTRKVSATQEGGKVAFELLASFAKDEGGPVSEGVRPADFADLPDPESLPTYQEMMSAHDPLPLPVEWVMNKHGIDIRTVNAPWAPTGVSADGGCRVWVRTEASMPDDRNLHAAALAYQSDESISDNIGFAFGVTWGTPGMIFVSLDHSMWFHRPFRMDEWLFIDQKPVVTAHSRGVATATVWNQTGELVATFTQEALLRMPEE